MNDTINTLSRDEFPRLLSEIPDPPNRLYFRGELPPENHTALCVVGSRKYTPYGKQIAEMLISGLRSFPVTVISGLALGIDALAHTAALEAGVRTVAIPGSGLAEHVIAPRTNFNLAKRIVTSGGALISEFEPNAQASPWSFPQRNRLMAGMSQATLVVEAGRKSGSLITARLAGEYNRDVLAVPGSVFSDSSSGTNELIRDGATPITSRDDLLNALGFSPEENERDSAQKRAHLTNEERIIVDCLTEPRRRDDLIRLSGLGASKANMVITVLEMKGVVKEEMGAVRRC